MRNRHAIFLLALLTCIVYFSSLWNQFVWDDEQFIYSNAYVRSFAIEKIFTTSTTDGAGIVSNYYRPLTTLSFAIDHALWGLNPVGFHLTNLSLHILAGILLFLILKKIRVSIFPAFVISLLFLLHPIQTEAVTYINSRGDSLYTVFGFLALLIFVRLLQQNKNTLFIAGIEFPFSPPLLAAITAICYACSILSKEIGIIFGGLLLITWLLELYYHNFHTHQSQRWAVATLIICALIAFGYLSIRSTTLNFQNSFDFYQDQSHYSQQLSIRLLTFTRVVFVYLGLLLVPYPLHMERSVELVQSLVSIWPWLFLLINCAALLFAALRLRRGHPIAAYGFFWFYLALLPVSGIIPINGILYEHWLYVPMIGFFLWWYAVYRSLPIPVCRKIQHYKYWLLVPIFLIASLLTVRQNYFWSTPIRLYTYLLRYTESGRIYNNLAMAYAETNQLELALQYYDKALSFGDVYPQIHHNKGNVYLQLGESKQAIAELERAIEMNPEFAYSYQLLLSLYVELKQFDQAYQLIELAQQQFPEDQRWANYRLEVKKIEVNNSAGTTPAATPAATTPTGRSAR